MNVTLSPVRYFTAQDVYHYTVENRPLQDLDSNIQAVAAVLATAAPSISAVLTAPSLTSTPSLGDSSTLVADTEFVTRAIGNINFPIPPFSSVTPKPNGAASLGTDSGYSRGDHVHPANGPKFTSVRPVTYGVTLDVTFLGALVFASGSSSYTLQLPLASSISSGSTITFRTINPFGVTLQASGTDQIFVSGLVSSVTLGAPITVTLVSDGVGTYYEI